MSGIVAIVSKEGAARASDEEMGELTAAYTALRGERPLDTADAAQARVVSFGTDDWGAASIERRGDSWLATAGPVHGPRPLLGAKLEELDGQFSLVGYDAERKEVFVASDPFGLEALYAAEHLGKTYVSSSALVLARHLRTRPSRLGLLSFLRAGFHFGAATSWEGIERLEPATVLSFTRAGGERRTYWRPSVDESIRRLSLEEAVACCLEAASETFRAYFSKLDGAWADLTGGYDTRLLGLLLRSAGIGFETNTRGDERGADRRLAHKLADASGWRLLDLTVPADWDRRLPEMLPTALAWADGNLEVLELAWVLWAHKQMSSTHRSLLIGGGGEHLRGFAWHQEFLQAGKSDRVNLDNWLDMRMLHPMDVTLFKSDPTPEVRDDQRARIVRWAEPYAAELNTTQLDVMYAYKITGHFGTYRSADACFLEAELPFYFKPVFTTAFSIDYRHRSNHQLMRQMISRLDPRLARVETSTGGPAEPLRLTNFHRFLPYYAQIGQKAVNKLSERSFGRTLLPSRATAWWCPAAARKAALASIGLNGSSSLGELRSLPLFEPKALEQFLHRAAEPDFAETTVLGRIITTELALRAVGASLS